MKKFLLFLFLLASPAFAQSVQMSPPVTARHLPYWVTSGVIGDGGSSADSPISSIGVTNNGGAGICVSSDRQTALGRNQLCFGAQTNGPSTISLQNYGTATPQNLQFVINGVTTTIPAGGSSFIFGNGPFTVGDVPCFQTTAGVVIDCGLALNSGTVTAGIWQGTAIAVGFGGTGAATAAGARTNLGLGTMATQNASAVAITGGTITGLPTPAVPADAANKSYVDSVATGLTILASSALATATVLPNTPTYANGSSGVGATLTAGTNTGLTVDGTAVTINQVVLVKNQAAPAQNGIYTLTTLGDGSHAWVLTRATYFDQASEMVHGSYTFITGGVTNANTAWTLGASITTVGTDAVTFNQFSQSGGGVTAINGVTGAVLLGSGLGTTGSTLSNTGVISLGGLTGAVTCGTGTYCSGSSISGVGGGGIFDAVIQYGADPTGVSSATTAIRNAVVAACGSGTKGKVHLQAGTYKIDGGLNLTGLITGCIIYGDGSQSTILQTTVGNVTNAAVDLVGSAGVQLKHLQIDTLANTNGDVTFGVLMASTAGQGCDLMDLDDVYMPGYFGKGAFYIYGCTNSSMNLTQAISDYASSAFVMYLGNTNAYSATSNFATINTGTVPTGLWNFYTLELHDTSGAGASNVEPLIINGSQSPNTWTGGVIAGSTAAAAGGLVTYTGSGGNTPQAMKFDGVQFYADNGVQAAYAFWANLAVTGLNINGINSLVTTSLLSCINGTTWGGLNITGNASFGVPVISAPSANACTMTGAYVDAQGQAVNMGSGGAITHSVLLRPGTITGTHGADVGTF